MKRIICLTIFLVPYIVKAQVVSPNIIATAGNQIMTDQIQLQWTIGELGVHLFENGELIFTEGFHQLFESSSTPTSVFELSNSIRIYPNPFKSDFILSTEAFDETTYEIFDVVGRLILSDVFFDQIVVNLEQFSQGVYFIRVREGGLIKGQGSIAKMQG